MIEGEVSWEEECCWESMRCTVKLDSIIDF